MLTTQTKLEAQFMLAVLRDEPTGLPASLLVYAYGSATALVALTLCGLVERAGDVVRWVGPGETVQAASPSAGSC